MRRPGSGQDYQRSEADEESKDALLAELTVHSPEIFPEYLQQIVFLLVLLTRIRSKAWQAVPEEDHSVSGGVPESPARARKLNDFGAHSVIASKIAAQTGV